MNRECFYVRKDYSRRGEFKRLCALLSHAGVPDPFSLAHHVFLSLFSELSYQCERNRLGCFPKSDFSIWFEEIQQSRLELEQLREILVSSGLLRVEGEVYFSLLFFEENEHLSKEYVARSVKGAEVSIFKARRKKLEEDAPSEAAALNPKLFMDVDGKRITMDEMKKLVMIVHMVDSIFGRPRRDSDDFDEGLVFDTCVALRKTGVKNFEIILMRLMMKRTNERLPRRAEQFMANFDHCIKLIEPSEGWGEWSLLAREGQNLESVK